MPNVVPLPLLPPASKPFRTLAAALPGGGRQPKWSVIVTHANEKEIGHPMGYPFKRFAKRP